MNVAHFGLQIDSVYKHWIKHLLSGSLVDITPDGVFCFYLLYALIADGHLKSHVLACHTRTLFDSLLFVCIVRGMAVYHSCTPIV